MTQTVVGVFDDYTQAQRALSELTSSGFDIENVKLDPQEENTEARQRALRGDDDNTDDGGGIMGFFRSLFGTDDGDTTRHADVYSEAVRRGSYMLTVHADSDDQADRACDIMNRYDPVNIDERSTHWQTEGWKGYDTSAPVLSDDEIRQDRSRYASSGMTGTMSDDMATGSQGALDSDTASRLQGRTGGTAEGETRIPVVQEELQVGKRMVERGGVRVFQRVVDTPVHEQVQLREEHVNVDRRPVDQPATEADLAGLKDASFEMRETSEEAVVAKTARVIEEVVVNKEVRERTESIDDTVRRTDVEVENLGTDRGMSAAGGSVDDSDFRSHWQTAYGSSSSGRYEDYAPAYQFGNRMHSDARYSDYGWNDAEPDIRSNWEQQHGGSHPWERVKDAVRYGWDKVTK
jgi:uncharacterized protein (TIGR02271 family)